MSTDRTSSNPGSAVRHALLHVILVLEAGVDADRQGRTAEAASLLRSGCNMADSLITVLPQAHAAVLTRRVSAARSRLLAAQSALATAAEDDGAVPAGSQLKLGSIESLRSDPVGSFVAPPSSTLRRPFWLLQQLAASMQGAGWITASLRIEKGIWLQDGGSAVLSFLGPKTRYLEALCRAIEPTAALSTTDRHLLSALESSLAGAQQAAADFEQIASQEDGKVEQLGRFERGMRSLLTKSRGVLKTWNMQQDSSQGTYVAWAFRLCNAGAGLERLLLEAHEARDSSASHALDQVIEGVHRLSGVLLRGPCRFLVEDALLLADRAMSERRGSLCPPDVKWV